jgi:predicted metal-dependent peptidase
MSDAQVSQALAEVGGVLKSVGQVGIRVLAVDAAVHTCQRVFRPEQVSLVGGGGTDMMVGLEAAARLKPRPEIVIVITDGETLWGDRPPPGVRQVIVCLVGDGTAPDWAKGVKVG